MKFKKVYILLTAMILLVICSGFVFAGDDNHSSSQKEEILENTGNNNSDFVFTDNPTVNSSKHVELKFNNTNPTLSDDFNITLEYSNHSGKVDNLSVENDRLTFNIPDIEFKSAGLLIKVNNTIKANLTLKRVYNVKVDVINSEAEFQSGNFTYKLTDVDAPEIMLINKTVKLNYVVKIDTTRYLGDLTAQSDNNGIVTFKNSEMYISYHNLVLARGINTITLSGEDLNIENPSQNVTITQAPIKIIIDPYSEYYNSGKNIKIRAVNAKTGDPLKFIQLHINMPTSKIKDYNLTTDKDGRGEIRVSNYGIGTHPITVMNTDTYNMTNTTARGNMTIKKTLLTINARDVTMYYNTPTGVTISVTKNGVPVSGVDVYVKIYSINYRFKTDKNGKISLDKALKPPISRTALKVGSHKMTVFLADPNYEAKSVVKTIKVKKATAKITSPKIKMYYKQNKYITIKLTNTKNKKAMYNVKLNIKLHISKKTYYDLSGYTDKNGKITFKLNLEPNSKGILTVHRDLKPGTYNVEITGKNTKNYKFKKLTTKIIVKKTPVNFVIKKVSKKHILLTVKNKKTGEVLSGVKVKIKVNSKIYTVKTNYKGIAKIGKVFNPGKYRVSVSSLNKYCTAKNIRKTVKITK